MLDQRCHLGTSISSIHIELCIDRVNPVECFRVVPEFYLTAVPQVSPDILAIFQPACNMQHNVDVGTARFVPIIEWMDEDRPMKFVRLRWIVTKGDAILARFKRHLTSGLLGNGASWVNEHPGHPTVISMGIGKLATGGCHIYSFYNYAQTYEDVHQALTDQERTALKGIATRSLRHVLSRAANEWEMDEKAPVTLEVSGDLWNKKTADDHMAMLGLVKHYENIGFKLLDAATVKQDMEEGNPIQMVAPLQRILMSG